MLCLSWSPVSAFLAVWGGQDLDRRQWWFLSVSDSELKTFVLGERGLGREAPSCAAGEQIAVGSQGSSWQQAEAQGSSAQAWKINVLFMSQVGLWPSGWLLMVCPLFGSSLQVHGPDLCLVSF